MLQIDAPPVENFWLHHWMRFGAWTRVGLRNHVLGGARILPGEWGIFRAPHAMRPFVQILRLLVETVHTKHLKIKTKIVYSVWQQCMLDSHDYIKIRIQIRQ